MSVTGSITRYLRQLKGGDGAAATPLWDRYGRRLVGLARARLHGCTRRAADEYDVAQSAFFSFCRGAQACRFPRLSDRITLWPLLVCITVRKAVDLIIKEGRRRPPGKEVHGESGFPPAGSSQGGAGINQVAGDHLPADLLAAMEDEVQRLLDLLPNEQLGAAARMRLEGYTNEEIADKFECSTVTVERWFHIIRRCWQDEVPS